MFDGNIDFPQWGNAPEAAARRFAIGVRSRSGVRAGRLFHALSAFLNLLKDNMLMALSPDTIHKLSTSKSRFESDKFRVQAVVRAAQAKLLSSESLKGSNQLP